MSKTKDIRKFQLKKGVIIPVAGTSQAYSNQNITDEIALDLIRLNPRRKALFAKLPDNLNDLLKVEKKAVKKPEPTGTKKEDDNLVKINETELTLDAALELLESQGFETRATTVKGVQNYVNKLKDEDRAKLCDMIDPETEDPEPTGTKKEDDKEKE